VNARELAEQSLYEQLRTHAEQIDDDALWRAADHDCTGLPIQLVVDVGMAAVDAYDATGRPVLLVLAMNRLGLVLDTMSESESSRGDIATTLGNALREAAEAFDEPGLLDDAVRVCRLATEGSGRANSAYWSNLSHALRARDADGDLPAAIECARCALELARDGHRDRAMSASNLGAILVQEFVRTGNRQHLIDAVDVSREAAAVAVADDADLPTYWSNLSLTQRLLGEELRDAALLTAAVESGETAVAAGSAEPQLGPLMMLKSALVARYEFLGDPADLDRAAAVAGQAVELSGGHAEAPPEILASHAVCLALRYELFEDTADLDTALALARAAVHGEPGGSPHASTLANILSTRYDRDGDVADLDEAIQLLEESAAADGASPALLSNLGAALLTRHESASRSGDLEASIDALERALELTTDSDLDEAALLANAANAHSARYERDGTVADLERALELGRQALEMLPRRSPDRPAILANTSLAWRQRFEMLGDAEDLDRAISTGEEALAGSRGAARTHILAELSTCRRTLFELSGDDADLSWALATAQQVADDTKPGEPTRCGRFSNLAACLLARYEVRADLASLDQAVRAARVANAEPAGPLTSGAAATNLSNCLLTRFELRGAPEDLDEAIVASRRAVGVTPHTSPFRAGRLSNLANVLRAGAITTADLAAADEAVLAAREATKTSDGDPALAAYLSNLALALSTRYDLGERSADLDEAVETFRRAVELTGGGHPDHKLYRSNLGMALRQRGEATESLADVDESVAVLREVVLSYWADHPDRAPLLLGLGNAWATRFGQSGTVDDLAAALAAWDEAIDVRASSPGIRVLAAEALAEALAQRGDWSGAAAAYTRLMRLLPTVAWHGLARPARESVLAGLQEKSGTAAAMAIESADPAAGIEALETGRSVLWQQSLDLRRDLDRVRGYSPVMADRLIEIAGLLASGRSDVVDTHVAG
jgi:tetratricopeptide (TPR) repeat protein